MERLREGMHNLKTTLALGLKAALDHSTVNFDKNLKFSEVRNFIMLQAEYMNGGIWGLQFCSVVLKSYSQSRNYKNKLLHGQTN